MNSIDHHSSSLLPILLLQGGYNTTVVMIATALLGMAGGLVGVSALLRQRILLGDALAHCTLPGVAGAVLLAPLIGLAPRSLGVLLAGALVTAVLGAFSVYLLQNFSRLTGDTAIALTLSTFFGLGVVLLSIVQQSRSASAGGIQTLLFGSTAALGAQDAYVLAGMLSLVVFLHVLLFKEFCLLAFDENLATVQGFPRRRLDLILLGEIVAVTLAGLQSVGLLLVIAVLVLPPVTARFWSDRLPVITVLAALWGALSCYIGAALSARFGDAPAGSTIVLVGGLFFGLSALFAPRRGVLYHSYKTVRLRLALTRDHLLRELLSRSESERTDSPSPTRPKLKALAQSSLFTRLVVTLVCRHRGLLTVEGGQIELTEAGKAEARRIARHHRLWQNFMQQTTALDARHVDSSADLAEHALTPETARELEETVHHEGEKP